MPPSSIVTPSVEYLAKDASVLTAGFTPSGTGKLHEGHQITLLKADLLMEKYRDLLLRLFVDDREFSLQGPIGIPSTQAIANTEADIASIQTEAAQYLQDASIPHRTQIVRMSDFLQRPGLNSDRMSMDFFSLLKGDDKATERVKRYFGDVRLGKTRNCIGPVCPDCHQGTENNVHSRMKERGHFEADCRNSSCGTGKYEIHIGNGDIHWMTNYVFMGVRDVLTAQKDDESVLHLYGGDYGTPWGHGDAGKPSKRERVGNLVQEIMQNAKQGRIAHATGPLLLRQGKKISKSNGDSGRGNLHDLFQILEEGESSVSIDVFQARKSPVYA